MIDNFKTVTFDLKQIDKVWSNTSLLYKSDKDYRVIDEVRNVEIRTFKNLIFTKFYNRLEISGSIHYFFNDGLHNANDFNITDCISSFKGLIEYFYMSPTLFKVIGLEYGFNIKPQEEVNKVLKQLKFYGRNKILDSFDYDNFLVSGTNYKSVKIYNKTQDCPEHAKPNTLRFEVKTKEREFTKKLGINTLEDLLNKNIYRILTESVLTEWSKVLIFDIEFVELSKKHTTEYWLDTIDNMHRNTFTNRKKDYFESLPKNSLFYRLQKQLKNKADKFLNCAYLTTEKKRHIVHNRTITKFHNEQIDEINKYQYSSLYL